ncbi:hypothetical protein HDV63DRAFT_382505 [Trichoderma sp. SZMC 28014]
MSSLDSFEKFPSLPPEIRAYIWQLSNLNPTLNRVIKVAIDEKDGCSQARVIAKRRYTLISREAHQFHQRPSQHAKRLNPVPDNGWQIVPASIPFYPDYDVIYVPEHHDALEITSCYLTADIRFFAVQYDSYGLFIHYATRTLRNIASSAEEFIIIDTENSNTTTLYKLITDIKFEVHEGPPNSVLLGNIKLRVWRAAVCKEGEEEGEISTLFDTGIEETFKVHGWI